MPFLLCKFILGNTHPVSFVLLSNCMSWHFYNYAFCFNKRLRQIDRFQKPKKRKTSRCWSCQLYKTISQISSTDGAGGSRQSLEKCRVLPQRHLAFLPMPPGSVISKSLMAKFTWVLLEQENSVNLYLDLSLLSSCLGPRRELCERAKTGKPKSRPTCKTTLFWVLLLLLIIFQSNLLIF